jgi:hypothetical protein
VRALVTDEIVVCPHCGLDAPAGRYCKFCGKPLANDKEVVSPDEAVSGDANRAALDAIYNGDEQAHTPAGATYPQFPFSIHGMDDQSMAILFSKSELHVLDKELDRLIAEISSTRQALDLQNADKESLMVRAKTLRKAFGETKARREELRRVEGELPITRILSQFTEQTMKLEKLKKAEKSLDEVVFDEEKKKLELRIKTLEKDLKDVIKMSKRWSRDMDTEIKRLDRELNRLEAKLKIGDVSQSAYDAKKRSLLKSTEIIERGKDALEETIKLAEKHK